MISTYEHMVTDANIPFHQMAYLLSKKLGSKKSRKVARGHSKDLASNTSDPPLKVLEEIEQLFYSVEGKDCKMLGEEAFLMAEAYLTNKYGETFWSIFSSRLEADLAILFKNHFAKVALSFDEERSSTKNNSSRIHALESSTLDQAAMHNDVRQILHHLETPLVGTRATDQVSGLNTGYPNADQSYFNNPSAMPATIFLCTISQLRHPNHLVLSL